MNTFLRWILKNYTCYASDLVVVWVSTTVLIPSIHLNTNNDINIRKRISLRSIVLIPYESIYNLYYSMAVNSIFGGLLFDIICEDVSKVYVEYLSWDNSKVIINWWLIRYKRQKISGSTCQSFNYWKTKNERRIYLSLGIILFTYRS